MTHRLIAISATLFAVSQVALAQSCQGIQFGATGYPLDSADPNM